MQKNKKMHFQYISIFVEFPEIFDHFHDYFATWSKYFATWDLFRAAGALRYSGKCLMKGIRGVNVVYSFNSANATQRSNASLFLATSWLPRLLPSGGGLQDLTSSSHACTRKS